MVSICLHCNSDTDTLENPNAGHKSDCPTKRKCAKCGQEYFIVHRLNNIKLEQLIFREDNHNQPRDHYYTDVDLCHLCELNIWNMIKDE